MTEKNQTPQVPQAQQMLQLTPQVQQHLTTLNIRIADLIQQITTTINTLITENQVLQQQVKELQTPVEESKEKLQICKESTTQ